MENEFTSQTDREIRRRGNFTIYDDGSVQSFLSRILRKRCLFPKLVVQGEQDG